MLQPTERPPSSRAPRLAASIMPGPPPVITVKPSALTRAARLRARARNTDASSSNRAEPKMVTHGPTKCRHAESADEVAHRSRNEQRLREAASAGLRAARDRTSRPAAGVSVSAPGRAGPAVPVAERIRQACRSRAISAIDRSTAGGPVGPSCGPALMDRAGACASRRRPVRTARDDGDGRALAPELDADRARRDSPTRTAAAARARPRTAASTSATRAASSSAREPSGSLCFDAQAPIWLSRGRDAKYASASSSDCARSRPRCGPDDRYAANTRTAPRRAAPRARALCGCRDW